MGSPCSSTRITACRRWRSGSGTASARPTPAPDRITRDDMVEYFRIHYAPDNCIVVLTGDFNSKTALDSIRAYFGGIPRQPAPAPPVDSEPEQRGERRVDVHYPAQDVSFQ